MNTSSILSGGTVTPGRLLAAHVEITPARGAKTSGVSNATMRFSVMAPP